MEECIIKKNNNYNRLNHDYELITKIKDVYKNKNESTDCKSIDITEFLVFKCCYCNKIKVVGSDYKED